MGAGWYNLKDEATRFSAGPGMGGWGRGTPEVTPGSRRSTLRQAQKPVKLPLGISARLVPGGAGKAAIREER
jgi:hypothetical protein